MLATSMVHCPVRLNFAYTTHSDSECHALPACTYLQNDKQVSFVAMQAVKSNGCFFFIIFKNDTLIVGDVTLA